MKYDHINFKPPKSVADAASRGLDYRQKATDKGGLTPEEASKEGVGSGVQRAVNLKNRDTISPEVIKKMVAFFSRHEKNKSIAPEHKDKPWEDKGHVAWLLWGGDHGKTWANKVRDQMDAADRKSTASKVASRYIASFMMVPKNALPVIKDHVLAIAEEGLHGGNPGQLMGAAVRDIGKVLSAHGLSNQEIHEFVATLIGQVKIAERHLQIDVDVVSYGKIVSLLNDALLNMSYDVNRGADKPLSTVYRILGRSAFLDVAESKKMLSEAITTQTLDFDPSSAQMGQILGTFSKVAKNLPPSVERYVKEHKEQGMDEGKAWAIAWSRYCQFKNPNSPHCKKDEYFENKKSFVDELNKKRILRHFLALPPEEYPLLFGVSGTFDNVNRIQIEFKKFLDDAPFVPTLEGALKSFRQQKKRLFQIFR